jgi:S-adenosylmethionine:tRNA ribosyltransferase-isomerase
MTLALQTLDFVLPAELEAGSPPEARGLARDEVRLMVSNRATNDIAHARFRDLPAFLRPGDVLAVNTSGTLNAALNARRADGSALELHLSTRLPADVWLVEARTIADKGTRPFYGIEAGERLRLPAGGAATLMTPHRRDSPDSPPRLWVARLDLPASLGEYLNQHGFPIRYSYVRDPWPSEFYQTIYATEPGSAEMPSAGRAFTPALITRLVANGVQIAPLILHTGVASLEAHEPPYEEYYRVPAETAHLVNLAHQTGRRVIAVGTTVVRALETVTTPDRVTYPGEGWTTLVITPEHLLRAVDGLITGLHEPKATHLAMLEALAGRQHLALTYRAALNNRYLWHEFGDLHLIL